MDRRMIFLSIGIGLHCVAGALVVLMLVKLTGMTLTCIIPAVLIGCASVPAVRGRPVNSYVGFGLIMGLSFWMLLSAVNQREFLTIIPVLLLAGGAVWLLQKPDWPALISAGVAIALCLGLAAIMCGQKPDYDDPVPDRARMSGFTTMGILVLATAYSGLGFAEYFMRESRRVVRSGRRKKRRPRNVEVENEE